MSSPTDKKVSDGYYTYGILYLSENFHQWEASQGKAYRAYRQAWAQRTDNLDPGEFPLNLNIEVTTRCNLACTFCPQPAFKEEERYDMPLDLYEQVIDEGQRHQTPAANLNGLGEPMLLKNLSEMIAYAKSRGFLDVMFHTNGTIMTEVLAEKLIRSGLDRIIFSVDSPDKETYEAMRIHGHYDKTVANVQLFERIRKASGKKTPIIRTTMVVTDKTVHQVKNFVDLWKPIVDQITLQDLTWRIKLLDGGDWGNREKSAIPVSMDEVREKAIEKKISFACPYLYQSSYAYGNGDVIPCSNPNARKHMVMGRYDKETLAGVWKGKNYTDIRKLHASGKWHEHPVCRNCEVPLIELYKSLEKEGVTFESAPADSPEGVEASPLPVASELAPQDGSGTDLVLQHQQTAESAPESVSDSEELKSPTPDSAGDA